MKIAKAFFKRNSGVLIGATIGLLVHSDTGSHAAGIAMMMMWIWIDHLAEAIDSQREFLVRFVQKIKEVAAKRGVDDGNN